MLRSFFKAWGFLFWEFARVPLMCCLFFAFVWVMCEVNDHIGQAIKAHGFSYMWAAPITALIIALLTSAVGAIYEVRRRSKADM